MAGLHSVVDAHAASHPDSLAAVDEGGAWTHAQLRDVSVLLAATFRAHGLLGGSAPLWSAGPQTPPRPVCLALPRGRLWYALCVASWRLGLPVAAVSEDLVDKVAERERGARIALELRPLVVVVDGDPNIAIPGLPEDCTVLQVSQLRAVIEASAGGNSEPSTAANGFRDVGPSSVLLYAYTGGTTKHSKCVVVTHSMALWEMRQYATVMRGKVGRADRVLQYTSAYWGAAAFGQLDIALAAGACAVFVPSPPSVGEIAIAVAWYGISVLGTVPSQLRGAFPGGPEGRPPCLRVVLTWGERLPVRLSQLWREHVLIIDLLIATEYWLALHSDCTTWRDPADGVEKHVLRPLPGLDMLLVGEDGASVAEGQAGELLLAGPTVSPGYVGTSDGRVGAGEENSAAYTDIGGRLYFRTRDRLRWVPGSGLVYCGRHDALTKRGGTWVDLEAREAVVVSIPGVASAAVVASDEVHVFLTLERRPYEPWCRTLDRVRYELGPDCRMHVRSELPLHPATAKIDRRRLQEEVAEACAREAKHHAFLAQMQVRMLRSHLSWYVLVLAVLVGPALTLLPLSEALSVALARLLLLPYLWAASLFSLFDPSQERKYYNLPLGPPDMLLLLTAALPASCLGGGCAAALALLAWRRDSGGSSSSWLLGGGQRAAAGFSALSLCLLVAAIRGLEPSSRPCTSLALCVVCAACLTPGRLRFLACLPVCCYLVLPKWLGDDWLWRVRCDEAWLRRILKRLLSLSRPPWDASLYFPWDQPKKARSWLGNAWLRSNVRLQSTHDGLGVLVDFWREVWSSAPAPPPSAPTPPPQAHVGSENGSRSSSSSDDGGHLATSLAALIERAGGCPGALGAMDSLQVITLAELVRREVGCDVSVADVLRCSSVEQLAKYVAAAGAMGQGCSPGEKAAGSPDSDGAYRVYMLQFPRHPVDWCVRYGGPGHLDVAALQRATDRLVARHSALRTVQSPDEPMRDAMDKAAALWQLWTSCVCGRGCGGSGALRERAWHALAQAVGGALFACWPRTIIRSAADSRVRIRVPRGPRVREARWDWAEHDQYVFSAISELTREIRWPFEIAVVPLYRGEPQNSEASDAAELAAEMLPPASVAWYIYCSITHAYSDGASGQALFADLLAYYAEEAGLAIGGRGDRPPATNVDMPEPFALLQRRLRPSLRGRLPGASDPNNDVFHEVACEDWGKRNGYSRRVFLEPSVTRAFQVAASDVLGCGTDVAWLTAVMGAVFRLFPTVPCLHLVLKVGCRDGPGERQMIGFLSEQRVFAVDIGDPQAATLLDIANTVASARRARAWRAPVPFESGLCVYVNIVSAMVDGLPFGFRHVTKPSASPWRWMGPAYCHLNLRIDQLSAQDWDIRIFHWDCAWGWEWSTYFALSLGGVIGDMVVAPTAPLLVIPRPGLGLPAENEYEVEEEDEQGAMPRPASTSLKRSAFAVTGRTADTQCAKEPPAKASRTNGNANGNIGPCEGCALPLEELPPLPPLPRLPEEEPELMPEPPHPVPQPQPQPQPEGS